ncbi:precorrin-4 C11-methyltransferase [Thalassoporum mexicanum PCC 7367]|uniref:precorrin-4 C(11)-methyltransferase n=1 Tax=Thalassoporum mexicanum TaxID=3457544 RepID=UPI00029FF450|nr:precorrin-4 C(11)-methyltransferase [Pseudanabaena sp. PCC 7367]AFY69492.1 precorrin-4 C11-methyltransferase [Pseudanabaena sp. PCC 7367]
MTTKPVYIVGAGPGDPELITIKGRNLLAKADVVIYTNSLIPREMLVHCQPAAEKIPTAAKTLKVIANLAIAAARKGKMVVRLHDGDPALYGAIHEQMRLLSEAGIRFEIIPGISAYQLAAARLGTELTIPGLVQTIILTRISGRTQVPAKEELASLAAHQASLCLYLSARHIENAQAKLAEHYPSDTIVAVCYRLGWPDEKIKVTKLSNMAAISRGEDLERTTLYLISPALNHLVQSDSDYDEARSQLYNPSHDHLFRPKSEQA